MRSSRTDLGALECAYGAKTNTPELENVTLHHEMSLKSQFGKFYFLLFSVSVFFALLNGAIRFWI